MYKLVKPLLFKLDPEKAHGLTIDALKMVQSSENLSYHGQNFNYNHPSLSQTIHGIKFNNPIGLAWDSYLKH